MIRIDFLITKILEDVSLASLNLHSATLKKRFKNDL